MNTLKMIGTVFVDAMGDMFGTSGCHQANKAFKSIYGTDIKREEYGMFAASIANGALKEKDYTKIATSMYFSKEEDQIKAAEDVLIAMRNRGYQIEYKRLRELSHGIRELNDLPASDEPLINIIMSEDYLRMAHEMDRDFKGSPHYKGYAV